MRTRVELERDVVVQMLTVKALRAEGLRLLRLSDFEDPQCGALVVAVAGHHWNGHGLDDVVGFVAETLALDLGSAEAWVLASSPLYTRDDLELLVTLARQEN